MTTFEIVKKLADRQGKSLQTVASDLGYSDNYFYSLKTGKQPSAKRLTEISAYFQVPVDVILGKETIESTVVDLSENKVVFSYDGELVTPEELKIINNVLKGLRESGKL